MLFIFCFSPSMPSSVPLTLLKKAAQFGHESRRLSKMAGVHTDDVSNKYPKTIPLDLETIDQLLCVPLTPLAGFDVPKRRALETKVALGYRATTPKEKPWKHIGQSRNTQRGPGPKKRDNSSSTNTTLEEVGIRSVRLCVSHMCWKRTAVTTYHSMTC